MRSVCMQFYACVSAGSLREKLQLVFDMCDRNRDGRVQREEFCEFVKSLNMAAGVKIGQEVIHASKTYVLYTQYA